MLKDNPIKIFEAETKGGKWRFEVWEDKGYNYKEFKSNKQTGGGILYDKGHMITRAQNELKFSAFDGIKYKIKYNNLSPEIQEIVC